MVDKVMVVGPWMLISEVSPEMAVTPSAGLIMSEERVSVLHCASTRANPEEERMNSMVDISREMVESSEVLKSEL